MMKKGDKVRVRIAPDFVRVGVICFLASNYAVVSYDGGCPKGNICTFDELEKI